MKQTRYFTLLLILLSCCTAWADFFPEYEDGGPFPAPPRDRVRRFVRWRVVSKKPDPDAEEETGIGFSGHAMNVLKGGTLGINFSLQHGDRYDPDKWGWQRSVDGFFKKREGRGAFDRDDVITDYGGIINPRVRTIESED